VRARRALPDLGMPVQRAIAWSIPGGVAAALALLFSAPGGPWAAPAHFATAFVLGAGFQHYYELRERAFSPAVVEAKYQALQSRIRPHFLFNSLNAVLSVIRTEPAKAERMLESIAELFRAVMADTRKLVPLQQEIELCRDYVEIEQTRLGNRLAVDWQIGAYHPGQRCHSYSCNRSSRTRSGTARRSLPARPTSWCAFASTDSRWRSSSATRSPRIDRSGRATRSASQTSGPPGADLRPRGQGGDPDAP